MPRDLKTARLIIISLLCTTLISCMPQLQDRAPDTTTSEIVHDVQDTDNKNTKKTKKKIALVIGNWKYKFKPLRNPKNDAQQMAEVLGDLGFDVIHRKNLSLEKMETEVISFKKLLQEDGRVGLFYFAGHGVEIASKNYLLPTDLRQTESQFIKNNAVKAQWVVDVMEHSGSGSTVNIVILDACRKIKYRETNESGLAAMNAAKGTIISFATGSGQTASDGSGENGLYTGSLLEFMKQPGLTIEGVFKKTRQVVAKKSGGEQVPWESNSMVGDFCLVSCAKPPSPQPQRDRRAEILQEQLENERVKFANERIKLEKERIKLEKERRINLALQQQLDESKSKVNPQPHYEPVPRVDNFKPGKVFSDRLKDGGLGPKMVLIPAGSFRMGDIQGSGYSDEKPVHRVSINRFAMSRYEVTFAEYDKFAESTGRKKPSDSGFGRGSRPVINVSWNDATAYAEWLSNQTRKQYR